MKEAATQIQPEPTSSTPEPCQLSVVIPAFNEEGQIENELKDLHEVLGSMGISYEVIVVDDGSEDATASRAEKGGCTLVRQVTNRGYGAALKRGIAEARSNLILITDADGTYPACEIPKIWAEADRYDMVVGARIGADVQVPLVRQPAKWFLRRLAGFLAGVAIPDLNSGLRLMRREHVKLYERILPSGFSFTTTITLSLLCNDYTVGYVPIDYRHRVGQSKIRASHAWHFFLLIVRAVVLFNPLRVFLPMGAVLFVAGSAKFAYDITKDNLSESAIMGLLGAVLIWSLGLLADQNMRLGMERKTWDRTDPSA